MASTGSTAPPRVELTADGIAAVTAAAGRLTGLSIRGARLLKFTNNAVVLLPTAGVVLRVAGSEEVRARVPVVVTAARWLQAVGLPAVRLHPAVPEALDVGGHLVTVWQAVPAGGTQADAADLAGMLRGLHAVDEAPPAELPAWNVAGFLRRRLGEAAGVSDNDLAFLHEELTAVDGEITALLSTWKPEDADDTSPLSPHPIQCSTRRHQTLAGCDVGDRRESSQQQDA